MTVMGVTNYVKGQTLHLGASLDPFAGLCSAISQPIAIVDTPQSITFELHVFDPLIGFEHDTVVNNDEIILPMGIDILEAQLELQVVNGAGNKQLFIWAEMNVNGVGWVAVPLTGTTVVMPPNSELIVSHIRATKIANGGFNKLRLRMQGNSTNLVLDTLAASAPMSAVPSCVFNLAAR